MAFSLAEDTIFLQQYFITGLIVPVNMSRVLPSCVVVCLLLSIPLFLSSQQVWNIKQHVSTKDCHAWQGSEYCVIGRVNGPCGIFKKLAMSLLLTMSAMSSSAVWNIAVIVWCTGLSIAFACGFLTQVGLCYRP